MNLAIILDYLVPAANYGGSLSPRNRFDSVVELIDPEGEDVPENQRTTLVDTGEAMSDQELYDSLRWEDERAKPTWEQMLAAVPAVNESVLEGLKKNAQRQIDLLAERVRGEFITQGSGQAMVYMRKVQEAETFQPGEGAYPLLEAEVAATGEDIEDVVAGVLAQRDAWLVIAAQIETTRLRGKKEVREAEDESEISEIVEGLTWPAAE